MPPHPHPRGKHSWPPPRPSLHLQGKTVRGWGPCSAMNSARRASGPHTQVRLARNHLTDTACITRQVTVSAHSCLPSGTRILCILTAPLPTLVCSYTHSQALLHTHNRASTCMRAHTHIHTCRWTHTYRHTNTCPAVIRLMAPAPRMGCDSVIYEWE